MKARHLTGGMVVGMVLLLVAGPAVRARAQGLGDAAKQERVRRAQPGRAPAKVYTTDELRPASQRSAPPQDAPAASEAGTPPSPAGQAPSPSGVATASIQGQASAETKGLEYWRERIASAAAAYDTAKQRVLAAVQAWNEDAMTRPRKARPMATMTEPGCTALPGVAEPVRASGGLARLCKTIPVYDMAIYDQLDAAIRAEGDAADEVGRVWAEAQLAGFTIAQLRN